MELHLTLGECFCERLPMSNNWLTEAAAEGAAAACA